MQHSPDVRSLPPGSGALATPGAPATVQPAAGQRPAPPDVMQWLRAATDATHKSVERKTPFFRQGFDRTHYVRWLVDMVGFYRPLEQSLLHSELLVQGRWPYQSRLHLLSSDLRQLGQEALGAAALSGPRIAVLPPLHGALSAAGALYVIEGSALGGQVLASRVLKALGISLQDGGSFFQPNGPEPRATWQAFQSVLGGMAQSEEAAHAIVQGAVATFRAFDAWLDHCGWTPQETASA